MKKLDAGGGKNVWRVWGVWGVWGDRDTKDKCQEALSQ